MVNGSTSLRSGDNEGRFNLCGFVPADMNEATFVVGARVNRTKVLFNIEDNIKCAGFQSGKSGKKRCFSAASGKW